MARRDEDEDSVDDLTEAEDDTASEDFRYSITSYGADYTVDGLVKRLENKTIRVPTFQRKYVWTRPQASRFIESLLLGLPVPGIFLAKDTESADLLVVDGQQRLRTLFFFYKGTDGETLFKLTGVSPQFEGKTYQTLSQDDRTRLDDSIIHTTIVKQDHPANDNRSIFLLFERINTGGTPLQPQEIRLCVYYGPIVDALIELNKEEAWRNVYGAYSPRMKDQELVTRFLSLYFDSTKYERPMKTFVSDYMASNRHLKRHDMKTLREAFVPAINAIFNAIGNSAFRPTRTLNAAVFDAVMVGVARRLATRPLSPMALKATYDRLLADDNFQAAYRKSTSDKEQVKARIDLATKAFAEA